MENGHSCIRPSTMHQPAFCAPVIAVSSAGRVMGPSRETYQRRQDAGPNSECSHCCHELELAEPFPKHVECPDWRQPSPEDIYIAKRKYQARTL